MQSPNRKKKKERKIKMKGKESKFTNKEGIDCLEFFKMTILVDFFEIKHFKKKNYLIFERELQIRERERLIGK